MLNFFLSGKKVKVLFLSIFHFQFSISPTFLPLVALINREAVINRLQPKMISDLGKFSIKNSARYNDIVFTIRNVDK